MAENTGTNIDIDLFRRIAHSDGAAFESLFIRYKEKVYAVARQVLKEPYLAEEVVQDVFTSVWQNRRTLTTVISPPAYLFRITRNRSIDLLRKQVTEDKAKNLLWKRMEEQQLLEVSGDTAELERLIRQAIDQLPPKRKEIFLLSRQTDLSYEAIAAHTGLSKNTVKTHLQLAVKEIREYLAAYHHLYWLGPMLSFFL